MKGEKINNPGFKTRVLVAPLEWGLGHATRCIPIINKLLQQNCDVIVAAEGACGLLLKQEFPNLTFLDSRGFRMRYARKKFWMPVKLLVQFPKMILSIYAEHRWLKKIVSRYSIDAVISDNRFGMYNSTVPCVYITHQLNIKTGHLFTGWLAQKIHYRFINKYRECWVPDTIGTINLAGELSHPDNLPEVPVKYLGPLSRFEKIATETKYDLAIILSGPEPQRTVFEEMILTELGSYSGKALLIRGLPGKTSISRSANSSLEIQNHLPAVELSRVIQQSKLIISRCGYTTVMDMVKLQKKAILVPTPGQTEQEYLANFLMDQKLFYCVQQRSFILKDVLKKVTGFSFNEIAIQQSDHEKIIEDFIKSLR